MTVGESKEPWLAKMPSNWAIRRIKDIAELKCGDGITSESITPVGDFPVFGGNGLRGYTTSFTHEGHYVLIGRQGALCGNINYAKGKFWASEHAVVVSKIGKIDTYWLGESFRDMNLNQYSNAAAQPGLAVDRIKFLCMPVPPLEEQQRIAAYLDASCAAIDAAVTAKCRQLETLDVVRGGIIETAITSGLNARTKHSRIDQDWIGSLPEHWMATRIKRVVSRVDYGISVSTESEGIYPVLKMGNIQAGEIVFSKIEFVDEVIDELLLETNDLLYNRTNSPDRVGKAALFRGTKDDSVTFASYLVRLRVNHRIIPEFLSYAVNCGGFLAFARKLAIPSVQQSNLNSTRYCRMLIPLPPVCEQHAICEHLDTKVEELKRVACTIEAQIATLTSYRQSLIHECVTGQRRISVADVNRAKDTR